MKARTEQPSAVLGQPGPSAYVVQTTSCLAAVASLVPVALYQLAIVKHLPDPPGTIFDSEGITSSRTAHPFGVPDSLPGLVSYSATLALLIAAHGQRASAGKATTRRLLGAKLALDGGLALFNTVRQVVVFRKLCGWCTLTALCTGVMDYAGRDAITALARTQDTAKHDLFVS